MPVITYARAQANVTVAVGATTAELTITKPLGFLVCEWVNIFWRQIYRDLPLPVLTCEIYIGATKSRDVFSNNDFASGHMRLLDLREQLTADETSIKVKFTWNTPVAVAEEIDASARFRNVA